MNRLLPAEITHTKFARPHDQLQIPVKYYMNMQQIYSHHCKSLSRDLVTYNKHI